MNSAINGADSQGSSVELVVDGMHCGSCAVRVQETLAAQPDVASAETDFANKRATILPESDHLDMAGLQRAVADIGYELRPVEETPNAGESGTEGGRE